MWHKSPENKHGGNKDHHYSSAKGVLYIMFRMSVLMQLLEMVVAPSDGE